MIERLIQIEEATWDKLAELAAREHRSRRQQIKKILEDAVKTEAR